MMNKKRIFCIGLLIPLVYGMIWFLSLFISAELNHFLYENHVIFLWLALPWSFFTIEVGAICSSYASVYVCNPLTILLVSIGFALNMVVLIIALRGMFRWSKR
ncbi:hypothetical protein [Photobacterium leiognathi]|uniref:hypothetical protein n=1 Tax=Photobacterium leiognathi TaxID=553611 RepID=UPI002739F4B0|nr:hypothetical protein [Photobacterium leiognathi]